jgi:ligand-binding sensor domain-containing protein
VVRVPTDGESIEVFDRSRGLPDDRVLSIASYRGNVVVGTFGGVSLIDDSLKVRPVAVGFTGRAWAVASSADTVWIGTDFGVRYALPGITGLFQPRQLSESPSTQVAVLDIAWKADTLVGMTNNELLWRDPATSEWALGPSLSGVLGRLHRMALYGDGFWIAGERGVAFATVQSPAQAVLRVGDALPGKPLDLVVQGDFLWVGTEAGVVRWRLDTIRP